MKIHIESLKEGHNHWLETVSPGELELESPPFNGKVTVEFNVEKRSGKIPVSIHVKSVGRFTCDRCDEEFDKEIDGECIVMFVKRDQPLPDEMPGDDLRTFLPGQSELDVTTDVRDALLLSLPLKLLCSEDCKGLCPVCGINLNFEECTCVKK